MRGRREAIAVDNNGPSVFDLIRYRRQDHAVTLCAFEAPRLALSFRTALMAAMAMTIVQVNADEPQRRAGHAMRGSIDDGAEIGRARELLCALLSFTLQ